VASKVEESANEAEEEEEEDEDEDESTSEEADDDEEDDDADPPDESDPEDDDNLAEHRGDARMVTTQASRDNASRHWTHTASKYFKSLHLTKRSLLQVAQQYECSMGQLRPDWDETAMRDLAKADAARRKPLEASLTNLTDKGEFCMLMSHHINQPVENGRVSLVQLPDPGQRDAFGIAAISTEMRTNDFGDLLTPQKVDEALAITRHEPTVPTDAKRYSRVLASQWDAISNCVPGGLSAYLPQKIVRQRGGYTQKTMYECFPYLLNAINKNHGPWTDNIPWVQVYVQDSQPATAGSTRSATPCPTLPPRGSGSWSSQRGNSRAPRDPRGESGAPSYPTGSNHGYGSLGPDGLDYSARR
jgi:hypothetical protein